MTEPAIRVSAVTKVFPTPFRRRRVVALRDLSLEIAPGEIYGMLGRIGLAQALIHHPKILVLDEPTAAVDPAGSRDIQNLIVSLKKLGTTILLSSHLLTQVQDVCDRVGILHRGKLLREGHLEDLLAIENQTELIVENATPDLLDGLERAIAAAKARVVVRRKPQTSLEQLVLKVTETGDE